MSELDAVSLETHRCSKCGEAHDRKGQSYCVSCHDAYMREWRKTHRLSGLALLKARARATTRIAVRRGKIEKRPCEVCGTRSVESHHEDYSKPLQIKWLCQVHHRQVTNAEARR